MHGPGRIYTGRFASYCRTAETPNHPQHETAARADIMERPVLVHGINEETRQLYRLPAAGYFALVPERPTRRGTRPRRLSQDHDDIRLPASVVSSIPEANPTMEPMRPPHLQSGYIQEVACAFQKTHEKPCPADGREQGLHATDALYLSDQINPRSWQSLRLGTVAGVQLCGTGS